MWNCTHYHPYGDVFSVVRISQNLCRIIRWQGSLEGIFLVLPFPNAGMSLGASSLLKYSELGSDISSECSWLDCAGNTVDMTCGKQF